jgi:hypothetical protein
MTWSASCSNRPAMGYWSGNLGNQFSSESAKDASRATRGEAGLTIVESAIAVAILAIVVTAATAMLLALNRNATAGRVMANAREVVQRNIEVAEASPFTADSVPPILSLATAQVWDDDGGGDNQETLYLNRDGTSKITGTLLRTVATETNSAGADIRRVTFHLDYSLFGRATSYEMTTIRALDK